MNIRVDGSEIDDFRKNRCFKNMDIFTYFVVIKFGSKWDDRDDFYLNCLNLF